MRRGAPAVVREAGQELLQQAGEVSSLAFGEGLEHRLERGEALGQHALRPVAAGGRQPERQRAAVARGGPQRKPGVLEPVDQPHRTGMGERQRPAQRLHRLAGVAGQGDQRGPLASLVGLHPLCNRQPQGAKEVRRPTPVVM